MIFFILNGTKFEIALLVDVDLSNLLLLSSCNKYVYCGKNENA